MKQPAPDRLFCPSFALWLALHCIVRVVRFSNEQPIQYTRVWFGAFQQSAVTEQFFTPFKAVINRAFYSSYTWERRFAKNVGDLRMLSCQWTHQISKTIAMNCRYWHHIFDNAQLRKSAKCQHLHT